MNPFNGIIEQGKTIWNSCTPSARVLMVTVLTLSLVAIIGVGVWSSRPDYVALASGLEPLEAAEIVSNLKAAGITGKLNYSGSSVLVPSSKWSEARLAAGDALGSSSGGRDEASGGFNFGEGSADRHHRLLRSREADLERSILKMTSVKSVDVHLAQPQHSPFARDQHPASASVVLGLKPGALISRSQTASIVHMVAASIEGLAPNDVTITDLNGHMLSNNSNGNQAYFEQLEYQNRIEAEKVAKAESLLQTYLGEGKAVVKVTAEVDFTKRTRSQKTYDPNSKVKDRETISSTESKGAKENPVGAAGTSSNLALTGQGSADSQSSEKTETIEASYRNGEANEKTEEQAGGIKRLTVSAIVDLSGQQSGGQGGQLTLTDVEDLIKSAVGFKAERTDLIKVISGTIPDADDGGEEIIAGVNQWEFVTTMVRNSSLGLAAVVALIALQLALRKMKPVTIVVDRDIDTKRERALSRLSTQIQENPEAVSKILSTWLRDSDSSGVESAKAA